MLVTHFVIALPVGGVASPPITKYTNTLENAKLPLRVKCAPKKEKRNYSAPGHADVLNVIFFNCRTATDAHPNLARYK